MEEKGQCQYEIRQRTGDGSERDVLVTVRKLELAGKPLFFTTWHETTECKSVQAELLESVRQLEAEKKKSEAIINAIGEGISIRDREYRLIYQNRINIDEVGSHLGEYCYQAFHGRDRVCEDCPVALSFKDGEIHTAEIKLAIGQEHELYESTASPILDPDGNIVAAIELVRNISEKKRAEQALREANLRMAALLHAIPDMVIFKDVKGRHLVVNRAAEKIIGLPAEELLGKYIEEIAPPEVACHCRTSDEKAMEAPESVHFEETTVGSAGETIYLDVIKAPIHDDCNNLVGVVMVSRDITERKRTEEIIKASEKRLRDITANLGVGLYVTDVNGEIVFMNPMAEQLWGWNLEELRNNGIHQFVHRRDADGRPLPGDECKVMQVIESGQAYTSTDEVFVRKDGSVFPVSIISTPLQENGAIVAAVTAFRDISMEKKLDAELLKIQKLESVGILAGGIAHDFNNILQAILGSISLARMNFEKNDIAKIPRLLQQAAEASEAAKELSFRLLTFAKGGSPVKTSTSVEEIIKKSVSLSLSGSNIDCVIDLPSDLPTVLVDGGQIMQVFNNILINAKEAMPQGGTINVKANLVSITEGSSLPLGAGKYLRISIRDTGCGIPADNLSKIFDPYFSAKGKGSRNGSGLGLSICLAIVRKHDGHISVESEPGRGTTFHIHLAVSPEEALPAGEIKEENYAPLVPKRILFMDDDKQVRDLVGEMMAALNCEVECSRHGAEAVMLYRESLAEGRPFAGVVLDLTVKGGMGGDAAIAELRKIDSGVKAVISSGYADSEVIKNFREYGFLGALAKPFTIDQLKDVLVKL